jgi:hypothetical protein
MSKGTHNPGSIRYLRRELEKVHNLLNTSDKDLLKAQVTVEGKKKSIEDFQQLVRYEKGRVERLIGKNAGLSLRIDTYNANYESLPALVRFFVPKALRSI